MSAKKKLARNVTVGTTTYGPGDDVPDEVMDKIRNPKAFIPDGDALEDENDGRDAGTSTGHRLASTVVVDGRAYGPKDPVPDRIARKIRNPKAWEGGNVPHFDDDADGAKPAAEPKAPARKTAPAAKTTDA